MSLTSKQIDELRAYAKDRKGELAKLINDAADTIEMLSAKLHASQMERSSQYYHGGWIPVSERLPDKYGAYIVTYKTDETDIATFDPDRLNKYNGAWSACDANGFYWLKNKGLEVIAWMPRPEPYREEGD